MGLLLSNYLLVFICAIRGQKDIHMIFLIDALVIGCCLDSVHCGFDYGKDSLSSLLSIMVAADLTPSLATAAQAERSSFGKKAERLYRSYGRSEIGRYL